MHFSVESQLQINFTYTIGGQKCNLIYLINNYNIIFNVVKFIIINYCKQLNEVIVYKLQFPTPTYIYNLIKKPIIQLKNSQSTLN